MVLPFTKGSRKKAYKEGPSSFSGGGSCVVRTKVLVTVPTHPFVVFARYCIPASAVSHAHRDDDACGEREAKHPYRTEHEKLVRVCDRPAHLPTVAFASLSILSRILSASQQQVRARSSKPSAAAS